jgi:hypothetical protein
MTMRASDAAESLRETLVLIGASAQAKHSGASLWTHLLGTFEILSAWGAPPPVCVAGLIHSIYATQYFRTAIISPARRREVAALVGARAERLAHLFCVVERQSIRSTSGVGTLVSHHGGRTLTVPASVLRDLRLIDLANETEQRQRVVSPPGPWLARITRAFRTIDFVPRGFGTRPFVVHKAQESRLLLNYAAALAAAQQRAPALLRCCVSDVTACAEPRILLAAALLDAGELPAAYAQAREGIANLRAWGVAWDTRVSFASWDVMAQQLIESARSGNGSMPVVARQVVGRLRGDRRSR